MKKLLLLFAAAAFLLTACAAPTAGNEESSLRLFYPTDLDSSRGGDAIASVELSWKDLPAEGLQAQAEAVVRRIMDGSELYPSPIPAGTQLRECRLVGGIVSLDFSADYGQLSGMDLTVADYCLTLSLTELPDIYGVRITVMGKELDYRKGGVLLAGNVLLTSTEDVVRELAAGLYFPNAEGVLTREDRLLILYEGQSRAGVVLDALLTGPETAGLTPLLPEGFAVPSARTDSGVCYVNISSDSAALLSHQAMRVVLDGISQSLRSIDGIDTVQYLLDGEVTELFG